MRANYRPRPGEPATAQDVARAIKIVAGVPMVPVAACGALFNSPADALRRRLKSLAIRPHEGGYLDLFDMRALACDFHDRPDVSRLQIGDEIHVRRSAR